MKLVRANLGEMGSINRFHCGGRSCRLISDENLRTNTHHISGRLLGGTSGQAEIRGWVGSLMDAGTGFHPRNDWPGEYLLDRRNSGNA
jgi:hypothetical protein